jgi:hypothetical protein
MTTQPISIKDSCIEVIKDLVYKSDHMDTCALRTPLFLDYSPLCDCGHSDGLEAAWDLIQILTGDGESAEPNLGIKEIGAWG